MRQFESHAKLQDAVGLGIVLLFWIVAGSVIAGLGSLTLVALTAFLTRGAGKARRGVIIAAGLFPFACAGWAGAVFVFQAVVNETVLDRDLGLGDTWHCPLPNGYHILFIDVTDRGTVYNPSTQGTSGGVSEQEDAVFGVRQVQVSGRYILGASTSAMANYSEDVNDVDAYFLLDTTAGKRTRFQTYSALRAAAEQLGIRVQLEPIYSVYSHYRFTWFDLFVAVLFCVPPIVFGLLLFRWIMRVRRSRPLSPQIV